MSDVESKDFQDYINYLPSQYGESTNLKKVLSIFLSQTQQLEDANNELNRVSTDIELAEDYQLDIIGQLVGTVRSSKTDAEYREEIYFRIAINSGNGTPEDCIQYLKYVTKATKIGYWEHYPASIIMETNGSNIPSNIPHTLDNTTLAGVSVGGVIVSEDGLVLRGCDFTLQSANRTTQINPYPNMESGGTECGSGECSYLTFDGYQPVLDSDDLARCMFPDVNITGESYFGFQGHESSAPFGDLSGTGGGIFFSLEDYIVQNTTRGILPDVYTK